MREVFRQSTYRFASVWEVYEFLSSKKDYTWAELKDGDKTYPLLIVDEEVMVDEGDTCYPLCDSELELVLGYKDIGNASGE